MMRLAAVRSVVLAPLLALAACDESTVDVPTIADRVEASEFCALHDQIRCAGALGCCGEAPPFTSEAACLAASECAPALQHWLESPAVVSGAVAYDAGAAADYLRAAASDFSTCAAAEAALSLEHPAFLIGTVQAGGGCDPVDGDPAASLVCAPGLSCAVSEDGGAARGMCTNDPATPAEACSSDEGCDGGRCEQGVCVREGAPPVCALPPPPDNGGNWTDLSTNDPPTKLRVTANSKSNAGTTNDITLVYRNGGGTYSCTITSTISDGGSQSCTPTQSSTSTSGFIDHFYVKYADKSAAGSSDGFRVAQVAVEYDGAWYPVQRFSKLAGTNLSCEDCNLWGGSCYSCWIDHDDHSDCLEFKVEMEDELGSTMWCIDHS